MVVMTVTTGHFPKDLVKKRILTNFGFCQKVLGRYHRVAVDAEVVGATPLLKLTRVFRSQPGHALGHQSLPPQRVTRLGLA